MKESVTYQMIVEEGLVKGLVEGRVEEARAILLKLGQKRFGAPPADTLAAIQQIPVLSGLEALIDRVMDVATWQELLAMQ
jgi:predicted transposase YdaD